MTGLCLAAGLLLVPLGNEMTLRWTHSIEKIRWEEDYRVEDRQLRLVEARVRGTGAGMEPPPGAVLRAGAWHYTPDQAIFPVVQLRHSPHAAPYEICSGGDCRPLPAWLPALPDDAVVDLRPCATATP